MHLPSTWWVSFVPLSLEMPWPFCELSKHRVKLLITHDTQEVEAWPPGKDLPQGQTSLTPLRSIVPRPVNLQAPQFLLQVLSGFLWPHFSFINQSTCTCHSARLTVSLYYCLGPQGTSSQLNRASKYHRKYLHTRKGGVKAELECSSNRTLVQGSGFPEHWRHTARQTNGPWAFLLPWSHSGCGLVVTAFCWSSSWRMKGLTEATGSPASMAPRVWHTSAVVLSRPHTLLLLTHISFF